VGKQIRIRRTVVTDLIIAASPTDARLHRFLVDLFNTNQSININQAIQ